MKSSIFQLEKNPMVSDSWSWPSFGFHPDCHSVLNEAISKSVKVSIDGSLFLSLTMMVCSIVIFLSPIILRLDCVTLLLEALRNYFSTWTKNAYFLHWKKKRKNRFGFAVFFKPIHSQIGIIYIYLLLLDWIYNVGDRQRQKKSGSNLLLAPYPILR